jgi:hypothetical protein
VPSFSQDWTFDEEGRMIRFEQDNDGDADNLMTIEYDTNGSWIRRDDQDGDGDWDAVEERDYDADHHETAEQRDTDGDGVWNYIETWFYVCESPT